MEAGFHYYIIIIIFNSCRLSLNNESDTDPYTSRNSALGFSGTLGGARTFGATATAADAQTENKHVTFSHLFQHEAGEGMNHSTLLPGGVSGRGASLSAGEGGVSSAGPLKGVALAPILARRLGGSSLKSVDSLVW